MKNKSLEIKAVIQIQKSANEVFDAIIDPAKMSNYFISSGSDKLDEGRNIKWRFPEFDIEFPIRVGKIRKDQYISFFWFMDEIELMVEISLTVPGQDGTIVTVTEKSRDNDDAGITWLKQNTEGWANFLACLKGYLEYGINLRRGAFDFMRR